MTPGAAPASLLRSEPAYAPTPDDLDFEALSTGDRKLLIELVGLERSLRVDLAYRQAFAALRSAACRPPRR